MAHTLTSMEAASLRENKNTAGAESVKYQMIATAFNAQIRGKEESTHTTTPTHTD